MRSLTSAEAHEVQIGLLDEVDEFCKTRGLRYYLTAGTLLGAVRHNGFIPWDDDVDVCMPRADYDHFCSEYQDSERFKLLTLDKDPDHHLGYARLCDMRTYFVDQRRVDYGNSGVFLDIFPLDGVPGSETERTRRLKAFFFRRQIHGLMFVDLNSSFSESRSIGRRVMRCIAHRISRLFSEKKIMRGMNDSLRRYPFEKSEYVANYWGWHIEHEDMPKSWFDDPVELEFEGRRYACPSNFDKWLRRIYGNDYMTPQRSSGEGHGMAYWRD